MMYGERSNKRGCFHEYELAFPGRKGAWKRGKKKGGQGVRCLTAKR